jgi:uncharacterized protein
MEGAFDDVPQATGADPMALLDTGTVVSHEMLAAAAQDGATYFELGCMYEIGRGVPADLVAAHKWFNIGASRGHAPAALRRREVAAELSADEVAAALRQARLFLTRH